MAYKKVITSSLIGKQLTNIFLEGLDSTAFCLKVRREFLPDAADKDIYLWSAALYVLSFLRAITSEKLSLSKTIVKNMELSLMAELINYYEITYKEEAEPDKLTNAVCTLIDVWDKNLNNGPSPHWYVGRTINQNLAKGEVNPALAGMLGITMSDDTVSIVEFLNDVQKKFTIEEECEDVDEEF